MEKEIKVVSLFDGISVAQLALKELGFKLKYWASEIEDVSIAVTQSNHPETIQLGDVRTLNTPLLLVKGIDLLIGGSPCQDLSGAKNNREGLAGKRSSLFYEYLRILKEIKPKYFILENVASMSNVDRDTITKEIGVEPIMIDAGLVSAQTRKRYFWTNIQGVTQPKEQGFFISDIIENIEHDLIPNVRNVRKTKNGIAWDTSGKGYNSQQDRAYNLNAKLPTIPTARTMTKCNFVDKDGIPKRLTYTEIEHMQGLPKNYTQQIKSKEKRGGGYRKCF